MKKERVWVYRQNNSYGVFHKMKRSYEPNKVYPLFRVDLKGDYFYSKEGYIDLAVYNEKHIPKGVYLDGVETGIDCEHCGDRWNRPFEEYIYIFEDREEYEIYKDALSFMSRCIVLSDFEKKEEIEEDLEYDLEFYDYDDEDGYDDEGEF